MRRFLFIVLILFIICSVFFMAPERQAPSAENPYSTLYRIMQLCGAKVVEGELHYWASLGTCADIVTPADLETMADGLLERMMAREPAGEITGNGSSLPGGGEERSFTAEKGLSHALYQPDGGRQEAPVYMMAERFADLQSGGQMRLLLQRMEQEGASVVHLLITVNQEGEARQLSVLAGRFPSLLGQDAQNANMSFCLTGHLDGELTPEEMEELCSLITREIGGEQLQSINDGKMISVTGYTPDLGDYLKAENLRINLNLAMRYDEYLDKTVIWAGTPLISRYY